jgi:hypothetical protein
MTMVSKILDEPNLPLAGMVYAVGTGCDALGIRDGANRSQHAGTDCEFGGRHSP